MLQTNESVQGVRHGGYVISLNMVAQEFPLFLITVGHVEAPQPFFTTRSERNDYQLIYTRSGTASVTYKGVTGTLNPGSTVLLDCMELHDYRTTSADPWIYDYVHFSGIAVKNYAPYLLDTLHIVQCADTEMLNQTFQMLFTQQLRSDILSCSRGFMLIAAMLNAMMEARELPELPSVGAAQALLPAVQYIRERYAESISLEKLSELCCLSKYYFIRSFRQATGTSPHQYLIKIRINEAKKLLAETRLPIERIAARVGFANYSCFVTQFRRLTNVSPSEYRNAITGTDIL